MSNGRSDSAESAVFRAFWAACSALATASSPLVLSMSRCCWAFFSAAWLAATCCSAELTAASSAGTALHAAGLSWLGTSVDDPDEVQLEGWTSNEPESAEEPRSIDSVRAPEESASESESDSESESESPDCWLP